MSSDPLPTKPRFTRTRVNYLGIFFITFGCVGNFLGVGLVVQGIVTPVEIYVVMAPFQFLPSIGVAMLAAAFFLL